MKKTGRSSCFIANYILNTIENRDFYRVQPAVPYTIQSES